MKKQLINNTAIALKNFGYDVYIAKSGEYGFYTNGKRVVCFGGQWNFCLDFSGNYLPSEQSGTGWQIANGRGIPTKEEAEFYINCNAPRWANNLNPIYTTPEQHLKTYGESSGYIKF